MPDPIDDLRAKLERATERVAAYLKPRSAGYTLRLRNGYFDGSLDSVVFAEAEAAFLADLSTLLDQAARVEALEGALRMCVDRFQRPEMSPDANVVLERALRVLSSPASTSPRVGGGDE